ncbi:putative rRNA methylase YtqB [Chlamydiales bacterium STE3]|nr:putative rRNA methylase YtqB [Chlamydiales bacterium STE3]
MASLSFLNSPIKVAHHFWKELIEPHDIIVDATLGNGQDALFLADLCLQGHLIGMDIQQQAIDSAKKLLVAYQHVSYLLGSHATFPPTLKPETVKLIVYNLGYLPRGDKSIVTKTSSTLASIEQALPLIMPGGMISLTCYSGHEEGAREEEAVLELAKNLNPHEWCVSYQRWINRHRCPSLVLMSKNLNRS